MKNRVERLRDSFAESDFDAYFSLSPPDNQYLTGFCASFDEVSAGIIITADETLFLTDSRFTEQANEEVGGFEIRQITGGLSASVGQALKELGVKCAAYAPSRITVQEFNEISKAYGGETKPNGSIVAQLRVKKSTDEIDLIRQASELAEGVLLDSKDALKAGVAERDVAAEIEYNFKRRGAEGTSFDTIALFGARSSLPHGMPGERTLKSGDITLFDLGCRRAGYCSDLTRTYIFGTIPDSRAEEIYGVVLDAQLAALQAIKPGVQGKDIDAVARERIADAGFGDFFGHGLGHGVGIEIHEAPRLNPRATETLEAGMVVTVEPGIYLPNEGGVRIEDLVVVTDTGCDILTRSSKELEVLQA